MDLISSDSEQQASFSEIEIAGREWENKSEITRRKGGIGKYQFKQVQSIPCAVTTIHPEISTESSRFHSEEITNLPDNGLEESSELNRKDLHEESVTLSAWKSIKKCIDCLLGADQRNTDHLNNHRFHLWI
ncbi:hypothetical protein NPIL_573241 [Nephila pilipes]|uniref:Uncharacterized protein n=1 Tax=Nephila pilipes TaxID=299642 RepID=A0A8X6QTC3_NEPPI|nr:hypothetical protein NPIL_573241 [Nephila pilipes]